MDEKIIVCLLFALFILPFASAVPPVTTTQQFSEGYVIQIPQDNLLKQNQNYSFEFHVNNISNGFPINSGINCSFHLYDGFGSHQFEGYDDTSSSSDYSFYVSGGNFSTLGAYYYYVQCNSTTLGGFAESIVRVTPSGEEFSTPMAVLYGSLFAILVFVFLITFFGIGLLPDSNTKDEEGNIISISYLKYLRNILWFVEWMLFIAITFVASNIAFNYLTEQLFAKTLFMVFQISFGLTPIIVIVWISWLVVQIIQDKRIRGLWERGVFPSGRI